MSCTLKSLSYYRTGGGCKKLFAPKNRLELEAALAEVHASKEPYFLLGAGSNSLVMDEYFPGVVISLHQMKSCYREGDFIYAEAGVINSDLSALALAEQLEGLAWMYRLPGQVGATVRMNARWDGGEISQVVHSVHFCSLGGKVELLSGEGLFRGYKDTYFMHHEGVVSGAWFKLKPGDPLLIQEAMLACEQDRIAKQQFAFPSCGCVFKNDYKIGVPSGMLLEASGAKSIRGEGFEVSPFHANFLFNRGASSRELLEATLLMREKVYREFGVILEYEMEILGVIPRDLERRMQGFKKVPLAEEKIKPLRDAFQKRLRDA